MAKFDPVIRKEVGYVSLWVAIAILPVQAAFFLLNLWTFPVLWGSLLGSATAIGNFLLMCMMIQRAVTQTDKQAKNTVKLSQSLRLLLQGLVLMLAACLPQAFNIWAAAIPLLIPRIAISLREWRHAKKNPHPDRPAIGWEDEDDED